MSVSGSLRLRGAEGGRVENSGTAEQWIEFRSAVANRSTPRSR
jgi:hypothetical protein